MPMNKILNDLLDLIYPGSLYCICCGKLIDGSRPYRLCNECMADMKWAVGRTCRKCGKPLSDTDPDEICYSCRGQDHVFRRGYAAAGYGSCERAVIFALKYGGRTDIADTLGEILYDRLTFLRRTGEAPGYDLILPVPMYRPKRRRRGFNQAELIARELARLDGTDFAPELVVRTRDTSAMKGLSPGDRSLNIAGAFEVTGDVKGLTILCIDDIYTTGATADELARVLLEAGAASVDFMAFAAGADRVSAA